MYRLFSKLMSLSKPVEVTDNSHKTLAYYGTGPLTVFYKSVMFNSTGPKVLDRGRSVRY
jgi:hypothetical protein